MVNPALGIANHVCVVSALSHTQSLTHAAMGHGPWLFPFGPAVLHGCTLLPLNLTSQLTDCRSTLMTKWLL